MTAGAGVLTLPAEAWVGLRLLRGLPGVLRRPLDGREARALLAARRQRGPDDFLAVARLALEAPASPYRRLSQAAGCEYGDIERLVRADGVEATLATLWRHGVYLTVEELKGRRPVVRGPTTFTVEGSALLNPAASLHVPAGSGGSRGAAIAVLYDLAFMRDMAVNRRLLLEARGGLGWRHAYWGVPGGASLAQLLTFHQAGAPVSAWFSQLDPVRAGLPHRYRWSARVLRWGGWLAGRPCPRPRHVPLADPLPIAAWMARVLDAGEVPHLHTFASSAVRLAERARAAGIDLRGAQLSLGSEPTTRARLDAVRASGATAVPNYGSAEAGLMAHGCLAPRAPDDLHLFDDLHAVVQDRAGDGTGAARARPLYLTSLRPTASLLLLNVSIGDQAVVERRTCGCPLGVLGWDVHVHTVRSTARVTVGGMAVLDADLLRLLEERLPARFGGGPTDYQLVEEETPVGHGALCLCVHPRVGPLDAGVLAEAFLAELEATQGPERVMGLTWRAAGLVRVERRDPRVSAVGKILHRYVETSAPPVTGELAG
jgi:hypothetical protein